MSQVDEIKDKISIQELVSEYVELKKSGVNYSGRCPFHNEKTPSFYVSEGRGSFKCFGCGEGGDIFTFLERIEGLNFREALEKLAKQAGVTLESNIGSKHTSSEKDNLYSVLAEAAKFWHVQLGGNEKAKEYLKQRGFTKELVQKYSLGFAPDSWNETRDSLLQKGHSESTLENAGLIKKGEKGGYYDRFRNRIVFPLFNSQGKICAFSARDFSGEEGVAKYLNSPETPVFNKSQEMYGFNFAQQTIRKNNFVLVVEGQVDLVMTQSLFPNTVATSGTSLTKEHLKLLRRFCDRVVFVFDSDQAGITAAYKATLLAYEQDFEVKIALIPEGADPADIILKGTDGFKDIIREAKTALDFFLHKIVTFTGSVRNRNKAIDERLIPLLQIISNSLEQDAQVTRVAEVLELDKALLLKRISQLAPTERKEYLKPMAQNSEGVPEQAALAIKQLARIHYWLGTLTKGDRPIVKEKVLEGCSKELEESVHEYIMHMTDEEKENSPFELEKLYENSIILEKEIIELHQRAFVLIQKQKLNNFQQKLAKAELEKNQSAIQDLKEKITKLISHK